jgi:hypothetical protein
MSAYQGEMVVGCPSVTQLIHTLTILHFSLTEEQIRLVKDGDYLKVSTLALPTE